MPSVYQQLMQQPVPHRLANNLRYGKQKHNPRIFRMYWAMCEKQGNALCPRHRLAFFNEVLQTFMETICDTAVDYNWRTSCLDMCYLPLSKIRQLSNKKDNWQDYRNKVSELATLSRYFLSGAGQDLEKTKAHSQALLQIAISD